MHVELIVQLTSLTTSWRSVYSLASLQINFLVYRPPQLLWTDYHMNMKLGEKLMQITKYMNYIVFLMVIQFGIDDEL